VDDAERAELVQRYIAHALSWRHVRGGRQEVDARYEAAKSAGLFDDPIEHWRWINAPENRPDFDTLDDEAARTVGDHMSHGGKEAWLLLRDIVRATPEDAWDVLGTIGAGPFESWISEERLREFLDDLEAEMAAFRRFRYVAAASWDIPATLELLLARYPPDEPADLAPVLAAYGSGDEVARELIERWLRASDEWCWTFSQALFAESSESSVLCPCETLGTAAALAWRSPRRGPAPRSRGRHAGAARVSA